MWLNNLQCGHKEGDLFPFFGEITIRQILPYKVDLPSVITPTFKPAWEELICKFLYLIILQVMHKTDRNIS